MRRACVVRVSAAAAATVAAVAAVATTAVFADVALFRLRSRTAAAPQTATVRTLSTFTARLSTRKRFSLQWNTVLVRFALKLLLPLLVLLSIARWYALCVTKKQTRVLRVSDKPQNCSHRWLSHQIDGEAWTRLHRS